MSEDLGLSALPRAWSQLSAKHVHALFADQLGGASCAADARLCSALRAVPFSRGENSPREAILHEGHTEPWSAGPVSPPHWWHMNKAEAVSTGFTKSMYAPAPSDTMTRETWSSADGIFTMTLIRVDSAKRRDEKGPWFKDEAEGEEEVEGTAVIQLQAAAVCWAGPRAQGSGSS